MPANTLIKVNNVQKTFRIGIQDVQVLKGITFEIYEGDFLVVFGPSGCGKSTLLHTLLGLEPPTSGEVVYYGDTSLYDNRDEDDRSNFRKKNVGMVYQQANWIRALNVRENVAFPLVLLGISKHEALSTAERFLRDVGMQEWADYIPTELSGGQQQRVSLARALINDSRVIVADEPTGNLDYQSGQEIMALLSRLNKEHGKTIIMVTHDLEYLKYSTRIVRMLDGQVEGIYDANDREKVMHSVMSKRGLGTADNAESVDIDESKVETSQESTAETVEPKTEPIQETRQTDQNQPDQNVENSVKPESDNVGQEEKKEVAEVIEEPSAQPNGVQVESLEPELINVPAKTSPVIIKPKPRKETDSRQPKKFKMKR